MNEYGVVRTIKIDPIEELLKANVIVGTMSQSVADYLRWMIAREREKATPSAQGLACQVAVRHNTGMAQPHTTPREPSYVYRITIDVDTSQSPNWPAKPHLPEQYGKVLCEKTLRGRATLVSAELVTKGEHNG